MLVGLGVIDLTDWKLQIGGALKATELQIGETSD